MSITNTASVIVPTAITGAMLISCTTPEPDVGETLWVSGTTYAVGDIRIRTQTHKKYMRKLSGAGTTAPESDPTNWLDIGSTARYAQFDQKIGTVTSATGGLTTVIKPGSVVQGLALMDVTGRTAIISCKDRTGGTVIYLLTINLDATPITSVYDWMFAEYVQKRNVILTDIPGQYPNIEITVTITGTTDTSVGVFAVGRIIAIGSTEYDAGAGIINFGKVGDDGFGNRTWIEGDWANRVTLPLVGNTSDFNRIHRQLAGVRSTPCIYIGSSLDSMEPLVCYGVYDDLYIVVDNFPTISMNLEISGIANS